MKAVPEGIKSAYFIGIGGIGMSALARHFHQCGVQVSGYDRDHSDLVDALISEGMEVHFTDDPKLLGTPDIVVYTPAMPGDHQQLVHARQKGMHLRKRSEVLGDLSREMRCIAVAGTHGKTTTSTMIAFALRASGVSCTAFLGGVAADFDGNYVGGTSQWMIAEADEYDRSFLQLSPEIAVITSMDPDHLDIYGSYEEMCRAYAEFLGCLQPGGMLIVHEDVWSKLEPVVGDAVRSRLMEEQIGGMIYGTSSGVSFRADQVIPVGRGMQFDIYAHQTLQSGLTLGMPGRHNVINATGAIACCAIMQHVFGMSDLDWIAAAKSLEGFKGIRRRFEIVHADERLVVIDDYAHHPKELQAAIGAAREQFPGRNLTGVFQPHLYSRTRDFYLEFAEELKELDVCILVDLYPAREQPIPGVSSKLIFDHVRAKEKYHVGKAALAEKLISTDPEILLFLGAGDLDRMIPELIEELTSHET